MSTAQKKINLNIVHYIIVLFLMFGFRYISPFGGLNEISMQVIGVFAGIIYGWITLSIGWPSILGLVAFGLTDYTNMTDLLVSAFASQTVVMIMGLLLLAAFIQQADDSYCRFSALTQKRQGSALYGIILFPLGWFCWCDFEPAVSRPRHLHRALFGDYEKDRHQAI